MPRTTRASARKVPAVLSSLPAKLSERLANLLHDDPEFRDTALEVGVIDQNWLDDPTRRPLSKTPPAEVMRRFVELAAERRPSVLTKLGLTAVQAITAGGLPPAQDQSTTLTVVFTDLEGFTGYTAQHGDAAALELLAEHHRAVGPVVRRWGGRVVKRLGDGLMLSFTEPGFAVRAAVELVGMPPEALRLRAGVHTGKAALVKGDVFGHAVNLAARVADLAKGGQVLVSKQTLDAAGELSGVQLSKPSRRRVKGIPDPVIVYRASPAA